VGVLRVTIVSACRSGIRRVNSAPAALFGVWIVTMLAGLPLSLGVRAAIAQHLGSSVEADTAASGANYNWMLEYGEQAGGVNATFGPRVIGFGAVLDNFSAFIDGEARPAAIVGVSVLYLVGWTFLAGGLIDRYARGRALGAQAFFQACGGFFGRMVRLAMLSGLLYGFLFGALHQSLFDSYGSLTHGVNNERTAFLIRVAFYLFFAGVLAAVNLLFDYAKIRLVVEDRRSAVGAVRAGGRFVGRHWCGCLALYGIDIALLAVVLTAYALVAPGAGSLGLSMWAGFAISQCYILARLWVKLVFWASEAAWFQSQLAHANYTAVAPSDWPESAVVAAAIAGASPAKRPVQN
jgi:hypothetical protein